MEKVKVKTTLKKPRKRGPKSSKDYLTPVQEMLSRKDHLKINHPLYVRKN